MLYDNTQIALERTIQGAAMRNEALASNLANANTPGYARVDVDFHGKLAQAMGEGRKASDSLHRLGFEAQRDSSGIVRADGSTVDVDSESAKLAANGLEHQAAVTVAGARVSILRTALGMG